MLWGHLARTLAYAVSHTEDSKITTMTISHLSRVSIAQSDAWINNNSDKKCVLTGKMSDSTAEVSSGSCSSSRSYWLIRSLSPHHSPLFHRSLPIAPSPTLLYCTHSPPSTTTRNLNHKKNRLIPPHRSFHASLWLTG